MVTNGGTAPRGKDTLGEAIDVAAGAAEEEPGKDTVTFKNGIRLRLHTVNRQLVNQAMGRIQDPEPPMADIGKGREEPNWDDPDYKDELQRRAALRVEVAGQATAVLATSVDHVPEGLYAPDDDGWLRDVSMVNDLLADPAAAKLELNTTTPARRYLSWLNYYAITTPEDEALFAGALVHAMGITVAEVQNVMATFPGNAEGRADSGLPAEPSGDDRDSRPPDGPRPRRSVRRARGGDGK